MCKNGVAVRACGPRVLVRAEMAPERTRGGLALPDTVRQAQGYAKGEVMAVGDAPRDGGALPPVGTYVYFMREHGVGLQEGDEVLILVSAEHLLAARVPLEEPKGQRGARRKALDGRPARG